MLFNAPVFLFAFLPVTWVGFRLISLLNHRASLLWLVVASLVFYGWWNPRFVPLLLCSMVGNYLAGEIIRASRLRPAMRQTVLIAAVAANIGLLGYYKYLVAVIEFLIGQGIPLPEIQPITLPLGISFFTFTQIAYLMDVAANVADERDPISYALFVTFFPHLIAGPILHHSEMMPQFSRRGALRFNPQDLMVGIAIFTLGLAKKNLIADPTSLVVAPAFNHAADLQFFSAWRAGLSYSLQLYFDFSGYSDMAIGLGRMFGIRLPLNFNSPYKAASVIEYWQRWHMTLTRYLTQYLFNPLALAAMHRLTAFRRQQSRKVVKLDRFAALILVPLPITMAIAGIWPGAGLQFLVFGLLHGLYLVVNHIWRTFGPKAPEAASFPRHAGYVLLTYICVLIGSVFFRAKDVASALHVLAAMIGLHGTEALPGVDDRIRILLPAALSALWLVTLYLAIWTLPNTQQIMGRFQPALGFSDDRPHTAMRYRLTIGWAIATGVVASLAVLLRQQAEFVYFQF
jgi:alginate O-acetyltransferase complex protein AlgI